MVAKSYQQGHEIIFDKGQGRWVYSDNGELASIVRPCKKCGKFPTLEGYDACLGHLDGIKSACCGHGVDDGFCLQARNNLLDEVIGYYMEKDEEIGIFTSFADRDQIKP